jgi:hypothetical protein
MVTSGCCLTCSQRLPFRVKSNRCNDTSRLPQITSLLFSISIFSVSGLHIYTNVYPLHTHFLYKSTVRFWSQSMLHKGHVSSHGNEPQQMLRKAIRTNLSSSIRLYLETPLVTPPFSTINVTKHAIHSIRNHYYLP